MSVEVHYFFLNNVKAVALFIKSKQLCYFTPRNPKIVSITYS